MIERYLEMPYWLIDILPKRVPEKDRGQYFSIEEYFLEHPQIDAVYRDDIAEPETILTDKLAG